jgi:hypothetical protein
MEEEPASPDGPAAPTVSSPRFAPLQSSDFSIPPVDEFNMIDARFHL